MREHAIGCHEASDSVIGCFDDTDGNEFQGFAVEDFDEFGELALKAQQPSRLGDRCTVFMESDLNSQQQKGASKDDLIGGLAYSIVQNYIQKVVGAKRIGNYILFQGGVTNNPAVVAAFEAITGKKIIVPPHFDVTGAIGAAMLAREEVVRNGSTTSFRVSVIELWLPSTSSSIRVWFFSSSGMPSR